MPHRIDIDHKHSRAIIGVIGKELRASLKPEPEQPESLRAQIERLRELEERSSLIVPTDEQRPTFLARKNPGNWLGDQYSMGRWRNGSNQGFYYGA